jgi:hypothetical protein
MARKVVLSICCGAFFTASLASKAQTFGDIGAVKQTRTLTQGAEDPAVSKWLMTLPADEDSAERARADARLSGQMLDANPIGGEVYHFSRRTALTRRPARDVTASIPRRENGTAVWYRLRGRTANAESAHPGALTAGRRTLPFGSRGRVINRPAVTTTPTRVSSRPSAAVRTSAAVTPAPTPAPAPATPVQVGYAYQSQPRGQGYPQPPATDGPVITRRSVSVTTARCPWRVGSRLNTSHTCTSLP